MQFFRPYARQVDGFVVDVEYGSTAMVGRYRNEGIVQNLQLIDLGIVVGDDRGVMFPCEVVKVEHKSVSAGTTRHDHVTTCCHQGIVQVSAGRRILVCGSTTS